MGIKRQTIMDWNRLSIFKLPNKHKQFNYHPRYYNERKESLNKKIKIYKENEGDTEPKEITERKVREIKFQADMTDNWGNSYRKSQSLKSNIRLIIILVVILAVFFYLFMGLETAQNVNK